MCVSRRKLINYEFKSDGKIVSVKDTKGQDIKLREIVKEETGDYYLEINSPQKALKESSMKRHFKVRFEAELEKAKGALAKRGGTKMYDKVVERVGKAMARYPSIAKYYKITYIRDKEIGKHMADITWKIVEPERLDSQSGIYFLRTNVQEIDEKTTWSYYNLIREIESTNRQLKTDLNLRPIYHQLDENSDAHIFLGLLAYWIVNTIRHQLKRTGIKHYWSEIVRIMSTQKAVTTEAVNALGKKVRMRICSKPKKEVEDIYDRIKYKKMPYRKFQICSTQ